MPRINLRKNPFSVFTTAFGIAFGTAAADGLRPFAQDELNRVWPLNAVKPLSPEVAAQAEIVGAFDAAGVHKEASYTGYSVARANALRAIAGTAPGFMQLAAMRNRGLIDDPQFEKGLGQLGIRDEWRDDVRQLRFQMPSGDDFAQMAVQGVMTLDEARAAAADVGTKADTFDRLYRLHGDPPGAEQLLDLWNRKAIGEDEVDLGLKQSRLKPTWVNAVKELRHYLIPPSDTIRLAVREVYDSEKRRSLDLDAEFPPAFAAKAALLGISKQDARDLWAGHWDLPSYTQGANMMFRGELSPAEFDNLLAALDYAPTWRDKLAKIARAIPTLSDMERFAVRDVYVKARRDALDLDAEYPDPFTAQAAKHGLAESDARDFWAAHWKLPSATQGFRMLWREELDEDGLGSLLKALDYAPTWRAKLANIARPVLGRVDLRRLLAEGVIKEADVFAGYRKLGYAEREARWLTDFAVKAAKGTSKEATTTDYLTLYAGDHLSRGELQEALRELGYDDADANRKADVLDARRVAGAHATAISGIHSAFKKHQAEPPEVVAALTKLGVAEWARAKIIEAWTIERDLSRPELTQAQIIAAYRRAVLARDEAVAQLEALGFEEEIANELLDTGAVVLTVKQIQDAVEGKSLTREEGLQRLVAQGYSQADAAILLPPEEAPPAAPVA